MFCSKHCMSDANRFHQFQCQVIDLNTDEDDQIFEVAHRQVFEALGIFGRIEKLEKFYEEHSEVKTVFDFNFTKADEIQKSKNMLQAMNSLQRNKIPDDMMPLMDRHVELMTSITKNQKHKKFLDDFMRKQMEIIITNTFAMSSKDGGVTGTGILLLSSFFNHSCAPNIVRINVENKIAFVVSRPIEKNKQLFVCYRDNFFETVKHDRQEALQKSYNFKCSCEACIKDYPIIDKLVKDEERFVQFSEITSIEAAIDELRKNCDYIDQREKKFPSYEICLLMTRNRAILEFIAEVAEISR